MLGLYRMQATLKISPCRPRWSSTLQKSPSLLRLQWMLSRVSANYLNVYFIYVLLNLLCNNVYITTLTIRPVVFCLFTASYLQSLQLSPISQGDASFLDGLNQSADCVRYSTPLETIDDNQLNGMQTSLNVLYCILLCFILFQ